MVIKSIEIENLECADLATYMPIKKTFTAQEVASFLSCSPTTVKRLCRNGQINAIKMGKIWRISRAALTEFIGENTNKD